MKENIKDELNQLSGMLKDHSAKDSLITFLDLRGKLKEKLGIVTCRELCPIVSIENLCYSRADAMKEFHIDPLGIYWEDADMKAEPDKPITRQQLLKRISEVAA